jgi:hypothetical protein
MSVLIRWTEMLTLPLPVICCAMLINLLSLPFTTTHVCIWCVGVSDMWNPKELGL